MGTHTYEQTIKYEVARDLLNGRIAAITDQIAAEEAKSPPDAALVDQLEELMAAVGGSISELDVTDEAGLDAVIAANQSVWQDPYNVAYISFLQERAEAGRRDPVCHTSDQVEEQMRDLLQELRGNRDA